MQTICNDSGDKEFLNTNPFYPYHSDRDGLCLNIERYRKECSIIPTLEELLLSHKREKQYLWKHRNEPSFIDGITNYDVHRIRTAFALMCRKEEDLSMTDQWKYLEMMYLIGNYVRTGDKYVKPKLPITTDMAIGALIPHDMLNRFSDELSSKYPLSDKAWISTLAAKEFSFLYRKLRQVYIADAFSWFDRCIGLVCSGTDEEISRFGFDASDGEPIFGITALSNIEILDRDMLRSFLKGNVFFGNADDCSMRMKVFDQYKYCLDKKTLFKLGGGMDLPFDRDKMNAIKVYHPNDLLMTIDDVERYTQEGIIVYDPRNSTHPPVSNCYVRLNHMPGLSDFGALSCIQMDCGDDMMVLGGKVMDAVDTNKTRLYDIFYGSLQSYMSRYIADNYRAITGKELIEENEIIKYIYLGAMANTKGFSVSLSHRKMCDRVFDGLLNHDYSGINVRNYSMRKHNDDSLIPLVDIMSTAVQRVSDYALQYG